MKKRVFSWLMILMMVMTIVPVYGEGELGSEATPTIVVTPVVESTPEPKVEAPEEPKAGTTEEPKTEDPEEPKAEGAEEPKAEAPVEPKTEATEEPKAATEGEAKAEPENGDASEPQATPVEPEEPSIDYDKTVAENELFDKGYVKLTGSARVYESADAGEA